MIKDISKLDDVQRNALFTLILSFMLFLSAITASVIGWMLVDTSSPNLHILAWVCAGICVGSIIILFVVYLRLVFTR